MSKELEVLKRRGSVVKITRPEDIEDVLGRILAMRFNRLRMVDEKTYRILRDSLEKGFELKDNALDEVTVADILVLIGYEPGVLYYVPCDGGVYCSEPFAGHRYKRVTIDNTAWECYVLVRLLRDMKSTDVCIRRFMSIDIGSLKGYLMEKTYRKASARIRGDIERSIAEIYDFLLENDPVATSKAKTIGDVIERSISEINKIWAVGILPIEVYATRTASAYRILSLIFMKCLRAPLVQVDRAWFKKLIWNIGRRPRSLLLEMEFGRCIEYREYDENEDFPELPPFAEDLTEDAELPDFCCDLSEHTDA